MIVTEDLVKFELSKSLPIEEINWQSGYVTVINGVITVVPSEDYDHTEIDLSTISGNKVHFTGFLDGSQAGIIVTDINGDVLFSVYNNDVYKRYTIFNLPDNSTRLYISHKRINRIKQDPYLFISYEFPITVTKDVKSWEGLEILQERDKLSGVFDEVTFPISFVKKTKRLLENLFEEDGVHSLMYLNVYRRHRIFNSYKLVKKLKLDFETYEQDKDYVTMEGASPTMNEYVQSYGRTKYDIPVSEIRLRNRWIYERMTLTSTATYTLPENINFDFPAFSFAFITPLNLTNVDRSPDTLYPHESRSQYYQLNRFTDDNFFFRADSDYSFKLRMKFRFYSSKQEVVLVLFKLKDGQEPESILHWIPNETEGGRYYVDVDYEQPIDLLRDEKLRLSLTADEDPFTISYANFEEFSVKWRDIGTTVNLDVIHPQDLLQRIVSNMTGSEKNKGIIELEEDFLLNLCAAETIRGYENAIIHTSFTDFSDSMKVLGYEYIFTENDIVFKRRDRFYDRDIIAAEIDPKDWGGLKVRADNTYCYSDVKIGFEKIDTESTNGRYEPIGTFDYTTGYLSENKSTLSMISKYKASSMELELLIWQRASSKDNKADNDVFFVCLKAGRYGYETYMDDYFRIENSNLFNAPLCPNFLIKRNESLLGIITDKVSFTATDSNREATLISGINIYADQNIEAKLFEPYIYDFATDYRLELPDIEVRNGLVKFSINERFNKKTYYGYIKAISANYSKETEQTWLLHAVKKVD